MKTFIFIDRSMSSGYEPYFSAPLFFLEAQRKVVSLLPMIGWLRPCDDILPLFLIDVLVDNPAPKQRLAVRLANSMKGRPPQPLQGTEKRLSSTWCLQAVKGRSPSPRPTSSFLMQTYPVPLSSHCPSASSWYSLNRHPSCFFSGAAISYQQNDEIDSAGSCDGDIRSTPLLGLERSTCMPRTPAFVVSNHATAHRARHITPRSRETSRNSPFSPGLLHSRVVDASPFPPTARSPHTPDKVIYAPRPAQSARQVSHE